METTLVAIPQRAIFVRLDGGFFVQKASTTKEEAIQYECPKCHAEAGDKCVEDDGITWRKSLHIERHGHAIENGARVRYIGGSRVFYADEQAA